MQRSDGFVLERVSSRPLAQPSGDVLRMGHRRFRVVRAWLSRILCVWLASSRACVPTRLRSAAARSDHPVLGRQTFGRTKCLDCVSKPLVASRPAVVVKARVSVRPNLEWGA
ncbi:hypothetical protein MRX96_019443 [Rhipicephalus microplus]